MTLRDGFDRTVSDWLDEDAGRGAPGYLDDVLARTARTRQRPAWSSLQRWLPMDLAARRVVSIKPGYLRALALLAILVLLVAALAVAVGSHRAVPPPFGLARNGAIVASANGDIFSINPTNGTSSPLIAGPTLDFGPLFSRDGTKFLFLRQADNLISSAGLFLVVANADGSGARGITPAVDGLDWVDWSPDGTRIAFLSSKLGRHQINVVNVDGTGLTTLDVGRPANQISWLPPIGDEILFRGEQLLDSDPLSGIFAVHPDGSGLRPISTRPALDKNDYQDVSVSPDGTQLAYRHVVPEQRFRVHVLDLRTGVDRALPEAAGSAGEGGAGFSPDGRSVVYLRWYADASTQLVVAPADGSGTGIALGPHGRFGPDGPTINNYGFTPDGTAVIANYDAEKVERQLPIDGSPGSVLARGGLAFAAYQRLAP